jgi:hypothetical protein
VAPIDTGFVTKGDEEEEKMPVESLSIKKELDPVSNRNSVALTPTP